MNKTVIATPYKTSINCVSNTLPYTHTTILTVYSDIFHIFPRNLPNPHEMCLCIAYMKIIVTCPPNREILRGVFKYTLKPTRVWCRNKPIEGLRGGKFHGSSSISIFFPGQKYVKLSDLGKVILTTKKSH